jgi:hypothetical protein
VIRPADVEGLTKLSVPRHVAGGGTIWQARDVLRFLALARRLLPSATMKLLTGILLALPLLATTACGDTIYINDTIDLDWDFQLTRPRVDAELHTPYVLGAQVDIRVSSSDEDANVGAWRAVSANAAILAIESSSADDLGLVLHTRATGGGTTDLIIMDGDHERARARIEVGVPDRVELDAHAWMIIGQDALAPVAEARVVEGGTATYLVRYFAGDRELHGNGALTIAAPAELEAVARQSFVFENREWLTLTPGDPGTFTIELGARNQRITTLPVIVVPGTEIDRVEIHGEDESRAQKDDYMVALAQAYDALDRRVFGVEYRWSVDDVEQLGEGDLYRYNYAPGAPVMLVADDGTHSAAAPLHVGEGRVDSSNNVGCAITAPGGR